MPADPSINPKGETANPIDVMTIAADQIETVRANAGRIQSLDFSVGGIRRKLGHTNRTGPEIGQCIEQISWIEALE